MHSRFNVTDICYLMRYCYYLQPGINPQVRKRLGEAAVKAAQAVNYVGAGRSGGVDAPAIPFYLIKALNLRANYI